jgi:hypothetical protein
VGTIVVKVGIGVVVVVLAGVVVVVLGADVVAGVEVVGAAVVSPGVVMSGKSNACVVVLCLGVEGDASIDFDEQALVAMESAHTAAASRFMNTSSPDFGEVRL